MNFWEYDIKLQSRASSVLQKEALAFCCGRCYPEVAPEVQISTGEMRNLGIKIGYRGKVQYFKVLTDNYLDLYIIYTSTYQLHFSWPDFPGSEALKLPATQNRRWHSNQFFLGGQMNMDLYEYFQILELGFLI